MIISLICLKSSMKNNIYQNFTIHNFLEVGSTNDQAKQMALANQIQDREIIVADSQNKGRGRLNRDWISQKGNLFFSILLKNPLKSQKNIAKIPEISFIAAISLRNAIEKLIISQKTEKNQNIVENKWPNDILINNFKVSGILLESEIKNNLCEFVVLGIGVNLVSSPENTMFKAKNLSQFGVKITKFEFLEKFLDEFEIFYKKWQDFGFLSIRNIWLEKAWKIGQEIKINVNDKQISGIFENIDENGNLILKIDNVLQKISIGDVS